MRSRYFALERARASAFVGFFFDAWRTAETVAQAPGAAGLGAALAARAAAHDAFGVDAAVLAPSLRAAARAATGSARRDRRAWAEQIAASTDRLAAAGDARAVWANVRRLSDKRAKPRQRPLVIARTLTGEVIKSPDEMARAWAAVLRAEFSDQVDVLDRAAFAA